MSTTKFCTDCKQSLTKKHFSRHLRTAKHQNNILFVKKLYYELINYFPECLVYEILNVLYGNLDDRRTHVDLCMQFAAISTLGRYCENTLHKHACEDSEGLMWCFYEFSLDSYGQSLFNRMLYLSNIDLYLDDQTVLWNDVRAYDNYLRHHRVHCAEDFTNMDDNRLSPKKYSIMCKKNIIKLFIMFYDNVFYLIDALEYLYFKRPNPRVDKLIKFNITFLYSHYTFILQELRKIRYLMFNYPHIKDYENRLLKKMKQYKLHRFSNPDHYLEVEPTEYYTDEPCNKYI